MHPKTTKILLITLAKTGVVARIVTPKDKTRSLGFLANKKKKKLGSFMKIQVASHSDCFLILLMSLSFAPFQFILSLDMQITKEAFREARLNDFKDVFNKRPSKDSLERKDLNELIQ